MNIIDKINTLATDELCKSITSTKFTTSPWCIETGFSPLFGRRFLIPIANVIPNNLQAKSKLVVESKRISCSSFVDDELDQLRSQWNSFSVWLRRRSTINAVDPLIQKQKLYQHSREHFIECIFWHTWNCFRSFSILSKLCFTSSTKKHILDGKLSQGEYAKGDCTWQSAAANSPLFWRR